MCKLVTDVMVIAGEAVALQHQLVSDMLIDMLSQIKPQFTLLPAQKYRDGQGSSDCEQRFIDWNYKGNGQDGGNYLLQRIVDGLVSIDDSQSGFFPERHMQYVWFGKCRINEEEKAGCFAKFVSLVMVEWLFLAVL